MGKNTEDKLSRWYTAFVRVRYQESDQMGVVYHANYLNWFEIGRTEMIRELGITYRSMEETGVLLPVTDLDMKFSHPARYDDEITIFTRMTSFSKLRIKYAYEVRKLSPQEREDLSGKHYSEGMELPGELLVSGTTSHVWVNREWQPARLDKSAPELYEALNQSLVGGGDS
ncbi:MULTISPECIES: acyl-CoA thioesterase [Paenibacillus]|uniref:4-hydroxybenzoyl-CoA thioesterase n=1 Tax=Paenibacillus azoreducens TaxID=116718 RepID=A0A919Y6F1_9BACL|nr:MULTISPECIES: thioesterase family protein [Paenibacillus]MBE9912455.1 acyl-CoA thioesterase [Paenibacillus donghaensis]GIO45801.1 4-hydroxybenzoyl-CoA thioesterase [Paenibacillus azoreducens]